MVTRLRAIRVIEVEKLYTVSELADVLGVSKETLRRWDKSGTLQPVKAEGIRGKVYRQKQVEHLEAIQLMSGSIWEEEFCTRPVREFSMVELFSGAGGLALGMEKAGFKTVLLNEIDKAACQTLKKNRPEWNVAEGDVSRIDFKPFRDKVDVVAGGFPCQAFSYAGKKMGFEDARGTLFFEFARAIKEIRPKVLVGENVRGLLSHEEGRTLEAIKDIIVELGYTLVEPKVLKAMFYQVPQKRERLLLVAVRNDLNGKSMFKWPSPYNRILNIKDALKKGLLYPRDVPQSDGQVYPTRKKEILSLVPQGGYWRDLPEDIQKEYMLRSYYLGGGKTGMARRLSWNEPSLTLTCAPAQKQTERCHPKETRPLTVREYARIQTFPDDWEFCGSLSARYKQIGNAVPVNLAYAVGRSLVRLMNDLETR